MKKQKNELKMITKVEIKVDSIKSESFYVEETFIRFIVTLVIGVTAIICLKY